MTIVWLQTRLAPLGRDDKSGKVHKRFGLQNARARPLLIPKQPRSLNHLMSMQLKKGAEIRPCARSLCTLICTKKAGLVRSILSKTRVGQAVNLVSAAGFEPAPLPSSLQGLWGGRGKLGARRKTPDPNTAPRRRRSSIRVFPFSSHQS